MEVELWWFANLGGLYFLDCILKVRTEEWGVNFVEPEISPGGVEVGFGGSAGVGIVLWLANKCCLEVGEDWESERSVRFEICGGLQLTGS